jgi:segregation and condensation protein B
MPVDDLKRIVEAALLAASEPLSLNQLNALFDEDEQPGHGALREAIAALDCDLVDRAVEVVEVSSGYRLQIRGGLMPRLAKLWAEKTPRYSRALLETLAIIAYRQPITRAEIEQIRGVTLSPSILRTLQERDWIKVVGHRDVPGRPELLGTTRQFLDYFNLRALDQLPTLAEIKDMETLEPELPLIDPDQPAAEDKDATHSDEEHTAQASEQEHEPAPQEDEPIPEDEPLVDDSAAVDTDITRH